MAKPPNDMIYKYTPHNKCHKYDIIRNGELWFAKIESLNDPIDSNLAYRQEYSADEIKAYWEEFLKNKPNNPQNLEEILEKCGSSETFVEQQNRVFANDIRAKIGVLCMSKNPKSITMWAHYANAHRGIVYEFDADLFGLSKTKDITAFPYQMRYPCNREYKILSYTELGSDRNKQYVKILTTKALDWFCEEEVRFFYFTKSGFGRKFNPECLKSIIFGCRTEPSEIETIIECCKEQNLNHITFKQAQFIKGRFELELNEIK